MTTTTLQTLVRFVGRELGLMELFSAIASATTTTLVVTELINTQRGSNHYGTDSRAVRPGTATNADYVRVISSFANGTGTITITGSNYSDTTTTSEELEIWSGGVIPIHTAALVSDLVESINESLKKVYVNRVVGLSHLALDDGDMVSSGVTSWAAVGTPGTRAKSTTRRRTPYGPRSLSVINDANDEGVVSVTQPAPISGQVNYGAIISTDVGIANLALRDITNTADVETGIAVSQEEPVLAWKTGATIAATCKEIALRSTGLDLMSQFINQAFLYKLDDMQLDLPSYMPERVNGIALFRAVPSGRQIDTDQWHARGLRMERLHEEEDFRWFFEEGAAVPSRVIMLKPDPYSYPIFVQSRISAFEYGALSARADTTEADFNQLAPRILMDYIPRLAQRVGMRPEWEFRLGKAIGEWEKATTVRPPTHFAGFPAWHGPGRTL